MFDRQPKEKNLEKEPAAVPGFSGRLWIS